jgi:hypothetical protein
MDQKFAKTFNKFESKRKSAIIANSKSVNSFNKFKINSNNKIRSDAITELELIYEKLNLDLNDDQLLDRAERRDLPFRFQLFWNKDFNHSVNHSVNNSLNHSLNHSIDRNIELSNSLRNGDSVKYKSQNNLNLEPNDYNNNNSYESFNKRRSLATIEALVSLRNDNNNYKNIDRTQDLIRRSRTPPYRRSAIPDIINDDFAFRKYNKSLSHNQLCSSKEINGFNTNKRLNSNKNSNSFSYLELRDDNKDYNYNYCLNNDLKFLSNANIKFDDLSNRKLRQAEAANPPPPHPPFGIPNSIVSHSSPNDYIRAEMDPKEFNKTRFRCKSNVPHLIHDDMAFRSFRIDSLRKNMGTIKRTTSVSSLPIPPVPQRLTSSQV